MATGLRKDIPAIRYTVGLSLLIAILALMVLSAITYQNYQYRQLSIEANEFHLRAASMASAALGNLVWIENLLLTRPSFNYSLARDLTTYQQLLAETIDDLLVLESLHGDKANDALVKKLQQQWSDFNQSTSGLENQKSQSMQALQALKPALLLTLRQIQRQHEIAHDNLTAELIQMQSTGTITIAILTLSALIIGAVVGWLVLRLMNQSLTRRHEAERALEDYRDHLEMLVKARTSRLETINQELEAFSYSVSHDLRTPLRSIDGFSQIILDDYGESLDAQARHYLERVRGAAQRMGKLIDDLISLSHINRASFKPERVDLSSIAQTLLTNLSGIEPRHEAEIDIAENLSCTGDKGLLSIALENLFSNAWKYTANTPNAQIRFDAEDRDGKPVFRVSDNGAGFDMQFSDKLFTAFERLHDQNEFEGSGIGLATVARIIHRHGGRIWANAETGKGATFYFTIGEAEKFHI